MNQRNELRSPGTGQINSSARKSSFQKALQNILGGGFLAGSGVAGLLPFLFFVTFLTILYIGNIYYAEKDIREINALQIDLKELRYEYVTSKSNLMSISKQSEVTKRLKGSGLKESVVPPYKLFMLKTDQK